MDYGDSVQKVLLRKIQKAEQDLVQLKLDYCRFIYGLTHRSRVSLDGTTYFVRSVDVDSMERNDDGSFGKPQVSGVMDETGGDLKDLGRNWTLVSNGSQVKSGS